MKTIAGILMATALLGCSGDPSVDPENAVTLRGQVSDQGGSQARFAGAGAVSASSTIEVTDPDGTVIGEGTVQADGTFEVLVPDGREKVVVAALDDAGQRTGAVLVEATGEARGTVTSAPIDAETSVEVAVWERLLAEGHAPRDIDTVDLRTRIFADLAAEISNIERDGETGDAEIDAVAEAVLVAQATRLDALADANVETTQEALWTAKLDAMSALSTDLADGADGRATFTAFYDAALDAEADLGIDARAASHAEHQASIAFRALLDARLGARERSGDALDAGIRTSGVLEAWTTDRHVVAVANGSSELDAGVKAQLELAGDALIDACRDARTSAEVDAAFGTWADAMVAEGGPVDALVGLDVVLDLDALLDVAADAGIALSADVRADVDALSDVQDPEPEMVSDAVVSAWTAFTSSVASATQTAAGDPVAAELLIEAHGSFRVQ